MGELCESEQGEGERDDFQVIKKNIALKLSVKNIDKWQITRTSKQKIMVLVYDIV